MVIGSIKPPQAVFGDMDLSNTRLHYVQAGEGPPLIIVPATVSLIRQWLPLTQFMGQRFNSYFFELPGHGGSTPYPIPFKSELVPKSVEEFVNGLGIERFNLMGFSFGGLLALRTLEQLRDRIDKVILLSPSVSRRALKWSLPRQWMFKIAVQVMKNPVLLQGVYRLLNSPRLERPLTHLLSIAGNVDRRILENKKALRMPITTLEVFAFTFDELMNTEYKFDGGSFDTPCYFGMSIHDDILEYSLTEQIVRNYFPTLTIQQFTHPYHQPPVPPTFEWLNREFGRFLEKIN